MIGEALEHEGLTPAVLVRESGASTREVLQVLAGQAPVTEALARAVERLTGSPAHIWTGLQEDHDAVVARIAAESGLEGKRKTRTEAG